MKKYTLAFLTTLLVLAGTLFSQKVSASHCAGGEITYAWLQDSTYKVTMKFYRDCTGIAAPSSVGLCTFSDCNGSLPQITMNQVGPATRATSTCTPSTCENPASIVPGYEEYVYSANVTLPSRCNAWHFTVSLSARNSTDNLIPNNSLFWVETTLNNVAAQGNSSPVFTVKPVPFVCLNKPYNYNNGVTDVNNDSLSFQMVYPKYGNCGPGSLDLAFPTNTLVGQNYALVNNPLPTSYSFLLSQIDGQLSFTPDVTGVYGIALLVKEYRNKVLIGTTTRDIQVIVRPICPNTPPYVFGGNPARSSGVNFTSTRIEGCVNKPLNLAVRATDLDSNERLNLISNNVFSAVGSTFTTSGLYTDTVFGFLAWTPTIADTGLHSIVFSVTDTNCATNGGVPITQSYSIQLYINPVTTASPDAVICSGQSYPMHVVGGGNWIWSVLPGGDNISSLSCTSCQNPVASPTVTTSYVVTALTSNSFCNINSDTVKVTVAPPAVFSAGPDTTTCVNNSLQLNAAPSGPIGNNYTISWTPATYLSNPNIANPIVSPTADITYIIKLTPAGIAACATYDTLNVKVVQGYTFTNPDTAVCLGASIPIRFTGDARYSYTWTPVFGVDTVTKPNAIITPDTSHIYTLTAKFPGCRDSVKSFYVDVQPNPLVYAGVDQIICYGDTIHIDAAKTLPAAYPNYTYSWSPAGAYNDPTRLNPIFTGFQTTTSILTVTTPAGCKGSDSAVYSVIAANFLTVSADTAVCPGDSAQLHVGGAFTSLAWTNHNYISDTLSANPYVFPITTTTYVVTGRDTNFCLDTVSVVVNIRPGALISLPDSVTIFPGDTYAISPAGNALYFSWFPAGGLSAANIANPIASPAVNTRYYVTATTEAGCTVRDSIDINVSLESYLDVPNAFSPGSQPNALLKIVHRGNVKVNTFKVFNRWGAQMFSTTDVNEGWNGQFNDQPQPMGVYVYIVDATTPTGRHFYKQGNVTLIR